MLAGLPSSAGDKSKNEVAEVLPLVDLFVKKAKPSLWIFSGRRVVCVAHCLRERREPAAHSRIDAKQHEIGVRVALGAGRLRLIRQLVTESALVACMGGAVGVMLSVWGVRILVATAPPGRIPRGQNITVDWRVLGVAFLVSLVAGLICGIFPALAEHTT